MRNEQRDDGLMVAVAGTSRFGKTSWVMSRIGKAQRILVWDPRGEYPAALKGCIMVKSLPELARVLLDAWSGPVKVAYWGPVGDFEEWARNAYEWLQLWPGVVIVEEMHAVTNSSKASGALGELIRQGLFYGGHIYGVCCRGQEIDKTTWNTATIKHCHFQDLALDQQYMAQILGVTPEQVAALKRGQWIEKRQDTVGPVFGGKVFKLPGDP